MSIYHQCGVWWRTICNSLFHPSVSVIKKLQVAGIWLEKVSRKLKKNVGEYLHLPTASAFSFPVISPLLGVEQDVIHFPYENLTNMYDDCISVFNSHGHMEPHIVTPILFRNISFFYWRSPAVNLPVQGPYNWWITVNHLSKYSNSP